MPKKVELKTGKNKASVAAFIASIKDPQKQKDSKVLLRLFKEVTGKPAVMWGTAIIGFGEYTYYRSNGDVGTYCATGFSPRANNLTLYILAGYEKHANLLKKLGPYKIGGKSCLHLKNLAGVDLGIIKKLIDRGLKDLTKNYEVR